MITRRLTCFTLLGCTLFAACDDEPTAAPRPAIPDPTGFAVLSSDWSTAAVSLLDENATVTADNYINSGSTETGLVTALSGDVDLPTRSGETGVLVLIDRYKTDVITRIRLSDGEVLGQVKTHTPTDDATDSAFSSNPQDYVRIDDHTAWVTRGQPNLDPDAAEIDRGDDLLRLDPTKMERTDERIDLSSLRATGIRTDPDSGAEEAVELYVRPTRMTRIANTLVVGLARSAFDYSAMGPGMVALVDLDSHHVAGFELEGLKGCVQVSPVPSTTDRVLVGCSGDASMPRSSEGVAILRIAQGHASIEKIWKLADHPAGPALSSSFAALDAQLVTAAANAFSPGGEDSVFGTLDLETGDFSELLTIPSGQGTFGIPSFDASTQKLFVPDASVDGDQHPTQGVHVLQRDDYLAYVHEIDHSPLTPNAELGDALEALPGRKLILTNGTRAHAEAVMKRLEIDKHFEDVFDVIAADLDPKPQPQVYDRFLKKHGVEPKRAAMFEDLARNLEVPHRLGMTTVLVVPTPDKEIVREGWEMSGRDAPHVDHVTDDIAGFLKPLAR